jgi:hypothetical protein
MIDQHMWFKTDYYDQSAFKKIIKGLHSIESKFVFWIYYLNNAPEEFAQLTNSEIV